MKVAIAIITCKRPQALLRLLQSLDALLPDPAVAVVLVVVDNDAGQSAAASLASYRISGRHQLIAVTEAVPGIPQARNTALRHCPVDADFIAFLDDDEIVRPDWLDRGLAALAATGADAAGGPVEPVYPEGTPSWVIRGRFFEREKKPDRQPCTRLMTNNCLLRAATWRSKPVWFDTRLQFTGSSDTLFFMQAAQAGWRMIWAADACVAEHIPPQRLDAGWIVRRQFRIGNGLSLCAIMADGWLKAAPLRIAKSLVHVGLGVVALLYNPVRGAASIARGMGGLSGLVGYRYQEYAPARLIGEVP